LMVQWYGSPVTNSPPPPPPPASGLTCTVRLADDGKTIGCEIEAAKPGFVANLKGVKTWAPAPTSGLHVAGHPVQSLPIEQPEEFDVPEKWREMPGVDDPTWIDEGDLT
jgi:hypothetical protein